MRKLAFVALSFLCCACAGTPSSSEKVNPSPTIETEDNATPGMIPAACESLLQKTQEWGYKPGEKWKPASTEQALAVVDFFAGFTLVPDASSHALQSWMNDSASSSQAQAATAMKKLETLQFCDHTLAMVFLEGVLNFRWPKEERARVGKSLQRFILNQQSRTSLLESRAVTVHVLKTAREKKLVTGSAASATKLRTEIQKAKSATSPLEMTESEVNELNAEKNFRKELAFSEQIRDRLSRELPLP